MKLYFQSGNGNLHYIKDVQGIHDGLEEVLYDLKQRAPHFTSYYQRISNEEDGGYWIDVGDHYCFYIIKPDDYEEVGNEKQSASD